jgi:hypothetical protein
MEKHIKDGSLLTAEEFLRQKPFINGMTRAEQQIAMIEFAKMHVEAALKEALESIPCLGSSSDIATYEEVEDAVLNCYPLTNIK